MPDVMAKGIEMKTIGLIGGLGPESTVDYYKEIISSFNTKHADLAYPEIIIYSANLNEFMGLVNTKQWQKISEWLLEKVFSLHHAGAEFAAIASNTPHIVFEEIESKLTMEADFYKKPFGYKGISVVVPSEEEQKIIHQKLFSEIELGIFKESTREELLAIVKKMVDEKGVDSLILGCTELPLILTEGRYGIPFLNTSAIHCESIVKYCIEK
jgi:aspartate racemase